jgi:O-acetyl-ADP-ribose deacetylase (regulator of RNase III)
MIEITQGDIFKADADAVVNPVNCLGVMGKGLALEFDRLFPGNSQAYRQACAAKTLEPGGIVVHALPEGPWKYILNVATKGNWRLRSRISDIQRGLVRLRQFSNVQELKVLALPALGCGAGGLPWADVLPCIERILGDIETKVLVYPPRQ